MVTDGHRMIEVNGVDLCVDAAGDAADPAILLISGMGGSMDWWEEEFCQRLAAGGRFVIRYDHRDTELLPLEGVGHQMPPRPWWTFVIAAMLRHTSG